MTKDESLEEITIPMTLGRVRDRVAGGAKPCRLLVHIADAHCHAPIQRRIHDIGQHLVQQFGFHLFAVEGTAGPIDVKRFRAKAGIETWVDEQLEAGKLTGPERLAILCPQELSLQGIENLQTYQRNHQAMVRVAAHEQAARSWLAKLGRGMGSLPGDRDLATVAAVSAVRLLAEGARWRVTREEYLAAAPVLAKLDVGEWIVRIRDGGDAALSGELQAGLDVARRVLADVRTFYDSAIERDKILFDNTLVAMRRKGVDRAVMVTGGFHVGGIKQLAKEQGIAAVFVEPNNPRTFMDLLGGAGDADQRKYLEIMKRQGG